MYALARSLVPYDKRTIVGSTALGSRDNMLLKPLVLATALVTGLLLFHSWFTRAHTAAYMKRRELLIVSTHLMIYATLFVYQFMTVINGRRPVHLKVRYCFLLQTGLNQFAHVLPIKHSMFEQSVLFLGLRVTMYVVWHGKGPYECSVLGVCTPRPGPNDLGITHTWTGLLVDFIICIGVPLFAGCFNLAMSWSMWRRELVTTSLATAEERVASGAGDADEGGTAAAGTDSSIGVGLAYDRGHAALGSPFVQEAPPLRSPAATTSTTTIPPRPRGIRQTSQAGQYRRLLELHYFSAIDRRQMMMQRQQGAAVQDGVRRPGGAGAGVQLAAWDLPTFSPYETCLGLLGMFLYCYALYHLY